MTLSRRTYVEQHEHIEVLFYRSGSHLEQVENIQDLLHSIDEPLDGNLLRFRILKEALHMRNEVVVDLVELRVSE